MSVETINAGGIFRVGGVLRRAWRLLTGNLLFFLVVILLVYAAMLGTSSFAMGVLARRLPALNLYIRPEWVLAAGVFVSIILPFAVNMLGQAVLVVGAVQRLRGQPLRLGDVLRTALARAVPLLGLILVWGLALGLCMAASALLVAFAMWGAPAAVR